MLILVTEYSESMIFGIVWHKIANYNQENAGN